MTCGELIDRYICSLADRPCYTRYLQIRRTVLSRYAFMERPAQSVVPYDIMVLADDLKRTPAHCKKSIQLISQSYNWGMTCVDRTRHTPLYIGPNPTSGVKRPATISRERVMDRREIVTLLQGLDPLPLKFRAFLLARLLTPCRIKELCTMRRADVNWQTGKWLKRVTKTGRPQYMLIPRQALQLMLHIPENGEYVFTGAYVHPIQEGSVRRAWSRVRADMGLGDVQLLDFRRTVATYLYTEVKADDLTAKAILGHYDGRPVAVYTRLNYDHLAAIIQSYADWVLSLRASHAITTQDEQVSSMPHAPHGGTLTPGHTAHLPIP